MQSDQQALKTQNIVFPNGNSAHTVFAPIGTNARDLLQLLNIPAYNDLIMLVGGASLMDEKLYPNLESLFTHGIAHLAVIRKALIIDGGSQAGVMELMGKGVVAQQHRFPLLGISPGGVVTYPGKSSHDTVDHEHVPLDPNHSHFVLVQTDEWGGETEIMYQLAQLYAQSCPSVAMVVNGGSIAKKEILYNVRQGRPIILFTGSGRAADEIAALWQQKPSSFSTPDLAEIIQRGNIHLFPITNTEAELVQLVQTLLQQQV